MLLEVSKTSKAAPFHSSHQMGLAVDFVPWIDGKWSWDNGHDYQLLKVEAEKLGLTRPISWDLVHVEHPRWNWVLDALRF